MNRRKRKQLSAFLQSNAAKAINEKIIKLENNSKTTKQIANGYFINGRKLRKRIIAFSVLLAVIFRKLIFLKA